MHSNNNNQHTLHTGNPAVKRKHNIRNNTRSNNSINVHKNRKGEKMKEVIQILANALLELQRHGQLCPGTLINLEQINKENQPKERDWFLRQVKGLYLILDDSDFKIEMISRSYVKEKLSMILDGIGINFHPTIIKALDNIKPEVKK